MTRHPTNQLYEVWSNRRLTISRTDGPSARAALSFYRPGRTLARIASPSIFAARGLMSRKRTRIPVALDEVSQQFHIDYDTIGVVQNRERERLLIGFAAQGELRSFVKVDSKTGEARLSNESATLQRLSGAGGLPFLTPSFLGLANLTSGHTALAVSAIPVSRKPPRLSAAELVAVTSAGDGWCKFTHGDFAPWNLSRTRSGTLVLFDWEHSTREFTAMRDLSHYVIQEGRLLGVRTPTSAVAMLVSDGDVGGMHARQIGLSYTQQVAAVVTYLREQTALHPNDAYLLNCLDAAL